MEEYITSVYNIAGAQAQHGHRCREKDLFQQWQWNHFCNQRHWEWNHLYCSSMAKKKKHNTLLLPAYKAIHLWCYRKRPINHMVNAISSYIFNNSSFPAWTSAGGKIKTLQSLPVGSVTILISQRRSQIQLVFFLLIPQTRYKTKASHAGKFRPDKKWQKNGKTEAK